MEGVGVGERKRPQQHAPDDGEDRGAGAEAERHRHQRDGGKRRPLAQAADGEPDVLPEVVREHEDVGVARPVAHGCGRAEAPQRVAPRLVRGYPRRDVRANRRIEVELELVVDLVAQPPLPQEIPDRRIPLSLAPGSLHVLEHARDRACELGPLPFFSPVVAVRRR